MIGRSRPFRMRNARANYDSHHGPNMTPMVDVVMVILIFFMASTAILGPEWFLRSGLASHAASAQQSPDSDIRVRIELRRDVADSNTPTQATLRDRGANLGTETPEQTIIPFTQLRDALARRAQRHTAGSLIVLIDAGDRVPYDEVVQVHEWCAQLGIQRVGLAP